MKDLTKIPFFIFDVESIGLNGEGFAVGGGVYINGVAQSEFLFCCDPNMAEASYVQGARKWVDENIPPMEFTHLLPVQVRDAFWSTLLVARADHPSLIVAGECCWPVEARFLSKCVGVFLPEREGVIYPLIDIASIMLAAGMDPMATYDRLPNELPKHHPGADARQSARLLAQAVRRLPSMALACGNPPTETDSLGVLASPEEEKPKCPNCWSELQTKVVEQGIHATCPGCGSSGLIDTICGVGP